jgi:hypothetical protein
MSKFDVDRILTRRWAADISGKNITMDQNKSL